MATDDPWALLYAAKVLGMQNLREQMLDPLRSNLVQVFADIFGSGGVLDAKASFTVTGDEFDLDADRVGYTPSGYRLDLDAADADSWQDLPFEDSGATEYTIGARWRDLPASAETGTDGQPHFGNTVEKVAEIFTPDSVALDAGGGLILTMTNAIPEGMKALTTTAGRTCWVWYRDSNGDPATPSDALAIEEAQLVRIAGPGWQIVTANPFGQAVPSADPADYRVAVLGPIPFRTAELPGDFATDWLHLGTITSGVYDDTSQPLVNNFGATIVAFNVEHDSVTGAHLDVNADTVTTGNVATNGLTSQEGTIDSNSSAQVVVRQLDGTNKIELRAGAPGTSGGCAGGCVVFPNAGEAADDAIGLFADLAAEVPLYLSNLDGGGSVAPIIDGRIVKNAAKAIKFAIEADDASDEVLEFRNVGAGKLDLQLFDGNLTVDVGDVEANRVIADLQASQVGFGYKTRATFIESLSPVQGGWTNFPNITTAGFGAAFQLNDTLSPNSVQPAAVGGNAVILRRAADRLNQHRSSPVQLGGLVRLVSFTIRYVRAQVADRLIVRLLRIPRAGGSPVVAASITAAQSAVVGGVTQTYNGAPDAIDSVNFSYLWEVEMLASAAVDDVRLMDLDVTLDKFGIE